MSEKGSEYMHVVFKLGGDHVINIQSLVCQLTEIFSSWFLKICDIYVTYEFFCIQIKFDQLIKF